MTTHIRQLIATWSALIVAGSLFLVPTAHTQASPARIARISPLPSILFHRDAAGGPPGALADTTDAYKNHAITGALVGGVVVGTAGAVLFYLGPFGNEKCVPCALGGFILGGVVGAVVGGLIGGQIPQ